MRAVTHCLALQIILLLCCESSPQGSCDNPDCGSNTPFWEREANLTRARAWYPRDEPALGSEHVVDVNQACVQAGIAVSESGIPLHAALAWAKPLPDRVVVFVMRAGENEGVFVQYEIGCHSTVAAGAAAVLGATPDDVKRPLRLFSVGGRPLRAHDNANMELFDGILHVYLENEEWVWAGVRVGLRWKASGGLSFETISLSPRVLRVHQCLTTEDAHALMAEGRSWLRTSETSTRAPYEDDRHRTSSTAPISSEGAAGSRVRSVSQQAARLTALSQVEPPQLVRYESEPNGAGQLYRAHKDIYVDHRDAAQRRACALLREWAQSSPPEELRAQGVSVALDEHEDAWLADNILRNASGLLHALVQARPDLSQAAKAAWASQPPRGTMEHLAMYPQIWPDPAARFIEPNRHATLLLYLNDNILGGETTFPLALLQNSSTAQVDHQDSSFGVMPECSRGLQIAPIALSGALFYHKHGNGTSDRRALHGGCPPLEGGTKWAINSFIWNVPFGDGARYYG